VKILVTGIAGAIGSHLAERLIKEGNEVVGIDCLTPYYSPAIKKINAADVESQGAKIFYLDLAKDDISEPLKEVEAVFHLAAQPGISASTPFSDYLKNNIVATERLIAEAKKMENLRAFIYASTSSVYGALAKGDESTEPKPTSHYGVTKLAAEQLVLAEHRDKGFRGASLRLFSVYGERERPEKLFHKFTKALCEDAEFPIYEGSQNHLRSYTYVGDIVDGCILALNNLEKVIGEIFNLGNDQTNTTGEGMKIIEEILEKKARLKVMPRRPGDQLETAANIDKARRVLGYNPQVSLREGLKYEVEWFKDKIFGKIS
jgi:UDP-glucuronate 4-epimerase